MTKTIEQIRATLAVAIDETRKAEEYRAADNPLAHLDVRDLVQGKGVRTHADQAPALNMNAKLDSESTVALNIEHVRRAGLADGRQDKSARRMAAARARAARKAQIDALADAPIVPSPERMTQAWAVVAPLSQIVEKIARSKRAWAQRFLGSLSDDIGSVAIEKMALVLAKDDSRDLDVLREAALELAGVTQRTGQLPGDQVVNDAERKHRKQVGKARKWLMGMTNNRVMGALVDAYTDQRNLRWENLDLIATVMASINGAGDDPMVAASKASIAPTMLGVQMRRPGIADPAWLAQAVTAAITDRGLDRMVELLLDDKRRRTDGAFRWADHAEAIFHATPDPWGQPSAAARLKWTLVRQASEKLANPRAAQADAARAHVRQLFAFLPSIITGALAAFDYCAVERVLYVDDSLHARVRSEFDQLIERPAQPSKVLRPALTFTTAEEAAEALTKYLSLAYDA